VPDFHERLVQTEAPGILRWLVQGCLDWQRHGLGAPAAVEHATAAYRREMDRLADFFEQRCELDPEAWCSSEALYTDYSAWCVAAGETVQSKRTFGMMLEERGFPADREAVRARTRIRRGLRLRTHSEACDCPTCVPPTGQGRFL
jgi:phage/plasmid-associated DNA primase